MDIQTKLINIKNFITTQKTLLHSRIDSLRDDIDIAFNHIEAGVMDLEKHAMLQEQKKQKMIEFLTDRDNQVVDSQHREVSITPSQQTNISREIPTFNYEVNMDAINDNSSDFPSINVLYVKDEDDDQDEFEDAEDISDDDKETMEMNNLQTSTHLPSTSPSWFTGKNLWAKVNIEEIEATGSFFENIVKHDITYGLLNIEKTRLVYNLISNYESSRKWKIFKPYLYDFNSRRKCNGCARYQSSDLAYFCTHKLFYCKYCYGSKVQCIRDSSCLPCHVLVVFCHGDSVTNPNGRLLRFKSIIKRKEKTQPTNITQ